MTAEIRHRPLPGTVPVSTSGHAAPPAHPLAPSQAQQHPAQRRKMTALKHHIQAARIIRARNPGQETIGSRVNHAASLPSRKSKACVTLFFINRYPLLYTAVTLKRHVRRNAG